MPRTNEAASGLDALQTLLNTAHELVGEILNDPLLDRVLRAVLLFPEPDRLAILKILEKEAAWRRITDETERATGIGVVPNPYASLYVHVLNQAEGSAPDREPLARDGDVIRLGIETLVRMVPFIFQEGVHAQWTAAAREIARGTDDEIRAYMVRLAREVLQLIEENDPNRDAAK
ncbi:MAG TPA: hypothetical protein VMS22_24325 [Candidatus Eisenbacteria bacterium]|nr:hypothetical protein [Candidatus Eisenbacteria bacterium]